MRYFLVDRITKLEVGKYIEGYKCWTLSEEYFEQHFPGMPLVPGALMLEGMAQVLGYLILVSYKHEFNKPGYAFLSLVHKAKFAKFVRPGDRTVFQAQLEILDESRATGKVKVLVDGQKIADATLSFIISQQEIDEPYKSRLFEYYDFITKDLQKN